MQSPDSMQVSTSQNLIKNKTIKIILSTSIFKTYHKLPEVQQESEDIIAFDKIKISLKKLKPIMDKQQFMILFKKYLQKEIQQHLRIYQNIGTQTQFTIHLNVGLEIIPSQILPAVVEYQSERYYFKNKFSFQKILCEDFQTVKQISQMNHINFKCLKQLHLKGYNIQNIQAISFINAPNLELLNLLNNKIVNIESLIKTQFRSLRRLNLAKNPIKKIKKFQRFHSKKFIPAFFQNFDLNFQRLYQQNLYNYNLIQDFGIIFKLETNPSQLCQQFIETSYFQFESLRKIPQVGLSMNFLKNNLRKQQDLRNY